MLYYTGLEAFLSVVINRYTYVYNHRSWSDVFLLSVKYRPEDVLYHSQLARSEGGKHGREARVWGRGVKALALGDVHGGSIWTLPSWVCQY